MRSFLAVFVDKINYTDAPKLVHSIRPRTSDKEKLQITGITILDLKLFVVTEKSKTVEVYDSLTFIAEDPLVINELSDPQDIVSSQENHILFIMNKANTGSNCEIIRLDTHGKVTQKWITKGQSGRLSTYESNLIACISDKRLVLEYSSEGDLMNTVRLSPGAGFEKLWHAIKVTGKNFAVSHQIVDKDRHRVCIVDSNGYVLQAFEELPSPRFKMNVPICLADDRDKSVLVADSTNTRLFLLSSTLQFEKVLIKFDGFPVRICLDETNGRIFVAENDRPFMSKVTWKYGRISIFNAFQARRG